MIIFSLNDIILILTILILVYIMTLDQNKESFNKLQIEINTLNQNKEILTNSYNFLKEKIKEFKENWKLEDYEIDFIKEQIKFHKKLAKFKKQFLNSKNQLTNRSRKKIEENCWKLEKTSLWKSELILFKKQIEEEQFKLTDSLPWWKDSLRDIIESNINIKYRYESIFSKQIYDRFFHDFTKKYLNNLEKKYTEYEIYKKHLDVKKWLIWTRDDILSIIEYILSNNIDIYKNFNSKLGINIWWKEENFYIKDIKEEIEETHKIPIKDKKEEEEEDIKILNPNKNLIKKRKHKNDILWVKLDSNILLSKHLEYNWLLEDNWEPKEILKILNQLINEYFYWQKILVANKSNTITKEIIKNNKEEIIKNFIIFINFILAIESYGWKNVSNKNKSWAEWYFQFKTNNNKIWYEIMIERNYIETSKETWNKYHKKGNVMIQNKDINGKNFKGIATKYNKRYKPNSLEMAIKRTKRFYWKNQPNWLNTIKTNNDWKILNKIFDIKKYWYEEQMILWLIDLFEREDSVWWKEIRQYIANILFWSQYDARELYTKVHHSQISSADPLVQNQVRDILSKLKIIL